LEPDPEAGDAVAVSAVVEAVAAPVIVAVGAEVAVVSVGADVAVDPDEVGRAVVGKLGSEPGRELGSEPDGFPLPPQPASTATETTRAMATTHPP
jgi:hypothetical protein